MKEISKKYLKELYLNNSNSLVCKELGITNPTLARLLKRCGIKLKGKGNRFDRCKYQIKP